MYTDAQRRSRVRMRYDRKSKRGCFFELAVDSAVLGSILFGLTTADGAVALDVWAMPATAELVRSEFSQLVQGLRLRGISLRTWRIESFEESNIRLDARA
jgi:hypothetical protein